MTKIGIIEVAWNCYIDVYLNDNLKIILRFDINRTDASIELDKITAKAECYRTNYILKHKTMEFSLLQHSDYFVMCGPNSIGTIQYEKIGRISAYERFDHTKRVSVSLEQKVLPLTQ